MAQFTDHGVAAERVQLEGAVPYAERLAGYNRIDIALDPTPYGGATTTAEALWMGVPVITLRGDTWVGRMSESVLSSVGLPELVAADPETYVRLASELAADANRRTSLRAGLRAMMGASSFVDGQGFTRHLETAYRGMWRAWCEAR
jgi:predicted O-linked N-acetylglucosamine transferase (SPINDLY family)